MKKWIPIATLAIAAAWWWHARTHAPADWPGRPANEPPMQFVRDLPAPWRHGDYAITPLARLSARAIVLSRCDYSGGHDGRLAPTDFALGWGCMSEAAVINRLRVNQDMRWFFYSWRGEPPAPVAELARSCANMHLIPATDSVHRALAHARRHDLLEFSGCLVEVRHADGWTWRSSLSREDSGAGACEVVWVEHAQSNRPAPR